VIVTFLAVLELIKMQLMVVQSSDAERLLLCRAGDRDGGERPVLATDM